MTCQLVIGRKFSLSTDIKLERDGEVGDKRDFSLPSLCLVGRVKEWKSRGIENFFVWLRRK